MADFMGGTADSRNESMEHLGHIGDSDDELYALGGWTAPNNDQADLDYMDAFTNLNDDDSQEVSKPQQQHNTTEQEQMARQQEDGLATQQYGFGKERLAEADMGGLALAEENPSSEPTLSLGIKTEAESAEPEDVQEGQRIKLEPGPDENSLKLMHDSSVIQGQNTQYAHLARNEDDPRTDSTRENSSTVQQLETPVIMDYYNLEAMNNADVRDQSSLEEVTNSIPPSSISTLEVQPRQENQDVDDHRRRAQVAPMAHQFSTQTDREQCGHQQSVQQNGESRLSQHMPPAMHEQGAQNHANEGSKPGTASSQAYSANVHSQSRQYNPRQPSGCSNDGLAHVTGALTSIQAPHPRTLSQPYASNSRNTNFLGPVRDQLQETLSYSASRALDTPDTIEKPRKKQQLFRPVDTQHLNANHMQQNVQRETTRQSISQHRPASANPSSMNITMPVATPQYGSQAGPSNYHFSTPTGHGIEQDFAFHGMNQYGQPMMPFPHPPSLPHGQQNMYDANAMHQHYQQYFYAQSQGAMGQPFQPFPPHTQHGYHMSNPMPEPSASNPYVTPKSIGKRKAQGDTNSQEHEEENDSSDDDEPLAARVRRHPSPSNRSDATDSALKQRSKHVGHDQYLHKHKGESVQVKDARPKQSLAINMSASNAPLPKTQPTLSKTGPPPRPLPQPKPQTPPPSNDNSDPTEISWKLPTYAIDPQSTDPETEQPSVKVSIPGIVRETLLLSPDHAAQETHLLQHLFLPGQQELATPDPSPFIATLNFHTVAVMVLDAYAAFEAGDELTIIGRTNCPTDDDDDDVEEESDQESKHNPRTADIDEIFLASLDRWRAGKASNKKSYSLIRGVQEFCDIALDIIYYIHEHGLVREHVPNRVRRERCDKGVKRGPRGRKAEQQEEKVVARKGVARKGVARANVVKSESAMGGGKRGGKVGGAATGKAKVNVLQARKKLKTGKEGKVGVVVTRRGGGKGT